MLSRRDFMTVTGSTLLGSSLLNTSSVFGEPAEKNKRKKLAVVTTEWRYPSHAWHMAERFLTGYPIEGEWHRPPIDFVAAYIDQFPDNDLSRDRQKQFGFDIYPSIAETLRLGGDKLAVDAVLIIGEHGKYDDNEYGQKKYPRYEFFKQVTDVYKQDGRSLPIFNDKHLSWKWEWAKEMVDLSRELKFPFLAGSSLPVTWRMPSVDFPHGKEAEEVMCLAMGGVDSYDFHALEVIQCMAERRRGGETGVVAVQGLRGESVWKAMKAGSWNAGGWNPELFEACLCRTQTLKQEETHNHRHPTHQQIEDWVKDPVAYRIEYADGLKATMLLMSGLVSDFTFAATIKNQEKPLSTLFYLPPNPNVVYSAALMSGAEEMFLTRRAPYPVERTLLTSGILESCIQSMVKGEKRKLTPHLNVRYKVSPQSLFWQS